MTDYIYLEGASYTLAGLGLAIVALVAILSALRVPFLKQIASITCLIVFTLVAFVLTKHATVALLLALIPVVATVVLLPGEAELRRTWWHLVKDERARTTPVTISKAWIISSLKDKMDEVLADGGQAIIVAGDGHPAGESDYPWRGYIEELLDRGCELTQYVVSPSDAADEAFRELLSYSVQTNGIFRYRRLADPSKVVDENDRHLIGMLATYHPTLASNDKGEKMLWVESHHPANSTVAYGCKYYSPTCLAADSKPFDDKVDLLKRAWAATSRASPA